MNNTTVPSKPSFFKDINQYIPAKFFFEQIHKSEEDNPYTSVFSFEPFFTQMQAYNNQKAAPSLHANRPADLPVNELIGFSHLKDQEVIDSRRDIIANSFPSLFFEGQLGFVSSIFPKEFFYMTPHLQDYFLSDEWEIKIQGNLAEGKMESPAIEAGQLILKSFYGKTLSSEYHEILTFRNKKTKLDKFFKINIILDYVETVALKPLQKLDQSDINKLYNEYDNEDYWLSKFPPEDFVFKGLVVGYIQDVTEAEVLSVMKKTLLSDEEITPEEAIELRNQLNVLICSYLDMPDVEFGYLQKYDYKYANLISWSRLGDIQQLQDLYGEDFNLSLTYGKIYQDEEAIIIDDLNQLKGSNKVELRLKEQGFRSLLFIPQRDKSGHVIGVLELLSKRPYRFNKQILYKLNEFISLFSLGTNRWIEGIDNSIDFFIQKQFTYIHPSVQWKFQEVSQQFLFLSPEDQSLSSLAPVVFKNVYPLYGQADIVGSSRIRNDSIRADMLDNLEKVQEVIILFRESLQFELFDIYSAKIDRFIHRLKNGGFVSSDESQIVEFLTKDIHPLLRELCDNYQQLPTEVLDKYVKYLDPNLDIVYRKRKKYEDSVQMLNNTLATFIDEEVAKKQKVLPHFFEKYTTDGVEYNIYLGQSILSEGKFSSYYLKDFRLWQLILMCEVTRIVEDHKTKLPVPLTTAQLIFVYNTALSIRFNMDEKQFDVDGAYNVRYEILKKRIDKAKIKGTDERLTQEGKLAIVYLQDKDRIEYMEYLQHLVQLNYISEEIEELELERLQGADGLMALRATVMNAKI
ncbi:MAG: GAF domain-containing protein [Bacteroidota bacterium]